ncbi:MAG: histidine phosphatase family protein [Myxococcota bacterium]|nr:histidine phosphatase family protein [Myxococcota bacterium]
MKLYVMRHGPAEAAADSGIDADRALTASGRDRVASIAKALLEAHEEPLHVFTSPLVRAVQTAEIVAIVTQLGSRDGTVSPRRELAPDGEGAQLARSLSSQGKRRVMLVGHEPDLSDMLSTILGLSFDRPFEKAMVVGIDVQSNIAPGRLRFLLDPKGLRFTPRIGA